MGESKFGCGSSRGGGSGVKTESSHMCASHNSTIWPCDPLPNPPFYASNDIGARETATSHVMASMNTGKRTQICL